MTTETAPETAPRCACCNRPIHSLNFGTVIEGEAWCASCVDWTLCDCDSLSYL